MNDTLQSLEYSLHHAESASKDDYANVTYRMSRGHVMVLSGVRGDKIYYEQFLFTGDWETIHHIAITYPAAAKNVYDPIVTRMSISMAYAH
jgi:hypothetical protein